MPEQLRFSDLVTSDGYKLDELVSMLQKTVRRGLEADALAAARALEADYGAYMWRRLKIIASEDCGLAWPEGPSVIEALFEWWTEARKHEKGKRGLGNSSLFTCHAVLALCRARKSRLIDHAVTVVWVGPRKPLTIPDFALDAHTGEGRRRGRTYESTYAESYRLANLADDVPDPYEDEARVMDGAPPRGQESAPPD